MLKFLWKLLTTLSFFAIIAAAGFAGYLFLTKKLTTQKIEKIKDIIEGKSEQKGEEEKYEKHIKTVEPEEVYESLANLYRERMHNVALSEAVNENMIKQLEEEKKRLEERAKELEQKEKELKSREDQLKRSRKFAIGASPEISINEIARYLQGLEPADIVSYLKPKDPATIAQIIKTIEKTYPARAKEMLSIIIKDPDYTKIEEDGQSKLDKIFDFLGTPLEK